MNYMMYISVHVSKISMYLYLNSVEDVENDKINEDQIYILATDADMEFKDDAVLDLLQLCNNDKRVGAACGRTYPQGKQNGPIVWHQIFEYAKGRLFSNLQSILNGRVFRTLSFFMRTGFESHLLSVRKRRS